MYPAKHCRFRTQFEKRPVENLQFSFCPSGPSPTVPRYQQYIGSSQTHRVDWTRHQGRSRTLSGNRKTQTRRRCVATVARRQSRSPRNLSVFPCGKEGKELTTGINSTIHECLEHPSILQHSNQLSTSFSPFPYIPPSVSSTVAIDDSDYNPHQASSAVQLLAKKPSESHAACPPWPKRSTFALSRTSRTSRTKKPKSTPSWEWLNSLNSSSTT